jgi:hypothetical protein
VIVCGLETVTLISGTGTINLIYFSNHIGNTFTYNLDPSVFQSSDPSNCPIDVASLSYVGTPVFTFTELLVYPDLKITPTILST